MLHIDAHGQAILQTIGKIATVLAGSAGQQRRDPSKGVAPRPLNMDHLSAELRELRADERLSDNNARANHPDAFERPEPRDDGRSGGALKVDKPVGKGLPQNFDLILVLDQSWVMSQC